MQSVSAAIIAAVQLAGTVRGKRLWCGSCSMPLAYITGNNHVAGWWRREGTQEPPVRVGDADVFLPRVAEDLLVEFKPRKAMRPGERNRTVDFLSVQEVCRQLIVTLPITQARFDPWNTAQMVQGLQATGQRRGEHPLQRAGTVQAGATGEASALQQPADACCPTKSATVSGGVCSGMGSGLIIRQGRAKAKTSSTRRLSPFILRRYGNAGRWKYSNTKQSGIDKVSIMYYNKVCRRSR